MACTGINATEYHVILFRKVYGSSQVIIQRVMPRSLEDIFFVAATPAFPAAELLTTKDISTSRIRKPVIKLTRIDFPKNPACNGAKEFPEKRLELPWALHRV